MDRSPSWMRYPLSLVFPMNIKCNWFDIQMTLDLMLFWWNCCEEMGCSNASATAKAGNKCLFEVACM